MRKTLTDLGCNDGEAYDSHKFRELSPFASMMINQFGEVWVGSNIYKYFDLDHYIQVENNDVQTILDIRTNGLKQATNIKWHDGITDVISASPTSGCNFQLFQFGLTKDKNDPTKQVGYFKFKFMNQNGQEDNLGQLNGSISWGDGTTSSGKFKVNTSYTHIYQTPPQSFLVSFSGVLDFCECTCSPTDIHSGNVIVNASATSCQFTPDAKTIKMKEASYTINGVPFQIELWQYFNLNGDFWDGYRARVDLTGKHFKNGKLSNPGVSMTMGSSQGSLYRDNCATSESAFGTINFSSAQKTITRKRGKHTEWNKNFSDNIVCNLSCIESAPIIAASVNELYWR